MLSSSDCLSICFLSSSACRASLSASCRSCSLRLAACRAASLALRSLSLAAAMRFWFSRAAASASAFLRASSSCLFLAASASLALRFASAMALWRAFSTSMATSRSICAFMAASFFFWLSMMPCMVRCCRCNDDTTVCCSVCLLSRARFSCSPLERSELFCLLNSASSAYFCSTTFCFCLTISPCAL